MVQHIYHYLSPCDFDSARRICPSWFYASFSSHMLTTMLKRGGWWGSISRILPPVPAGGQRSLESLGIMSRWIARERAISSVSEGAFSEVGFTDFRHLQPDPGRVVLPEDIVFTSSLCGSFLLVGVRDSVYVYELNHSCLGERRRWATTEQQRQGTSRGSLRPVVRIHCERTVVSCSMDTSKGRNSVAMLTEGRLGFVCDIPPDRLGIDGLDSASVSWPEAGAAGVTGRRHEIGDRCVCERQPAHWEPPVETNVSSVYQSICFPDDPPRSVAIHPQRNCVAFGCSGGIELYWTDAVRGTHLSRWFPLASPSDYLYFMPPRAGVDTAKRLRLIGSAIALESPLETFGNIIHGLNPAILGSRSTSTMPLAGRTLEEAAGQHVAPRGRPSRRAGAVFRIRDLLNRVHVPRADPSGAFPSDNNVFHYRAVPLSDGYHILFTDPWSGSLCLGTDAPVGSLTRLIRKVWFSPPEDAASPAPILYASGADVRHGVRVVATFAAREGDPAEPAEAAETTEPWRPRPESTEGGEEHDAACTTSHRQIIVFYTIPADVFHDITRGDLASVSPGAWQAPGEHKDVPEWVPWWGENASSDRTVSGGQYYCPFEYPIEIRGQAVAMCSGLVEIAVEASPDMTIWAFSDEGWARTWSLSGDEMVPPCRSVVQRDGSLRYVSSDGGTMVMADAGTPPPPVEEETREPAPFDGTSTQTMASSSLPALAERGRATPLPGRISWTVSVDVVEQVSGIVRVDVDLRW